MDHDEEQEHENSSEQKDVGILKSPSPPAPALIYITLFAVQLVFVLWFFVAKHAMAKVDLPPLVFAAYREVVATALLLVLAKLMCSGGGIVLYDIRPHACTFLLLGFLMFVNVAGFIVGLSMVTSFNAAILQPTQPVFSAIIAWFCRYERMSLAKAMSIVMACSGAALTVWLGAVATSEPATTGGEKRQDLNPRLGTAIILMQCICSGAMWVVQKRVLTVIKSPMVVTAVSYTIASFFTVAVTIASRGVHDPLLYVTAPVAWASIAYAAVFATVFTYYAMAWANNWADPSTVALSLSLQPLLTALFSFLGGGPPLVPLQILSCGLIIAGLVVKVYDQEHVVVGTGGGKTTSMVELPVKESKPLILD